MMGKRWWIQFAMGFVVMAAVILAAIAHCWFNPPQGTPASGH
ncbi:MAG: hypothetical protein ACYSWU_22260 [Planctomycetota bacterium]|jgi:hypothetical protein